MRSKLYNLGFSLTEVLLAVGTLAIGMLFIAGTFLAGVHFTTIATERTIAAVAADEAFAKIKLYAIANPLDPNDDIDLNRLNPSDLMYINDVLRVQIAFSEFAYPSTRTNPEEKQYYWYALCRRADLFDPNMVQVTVFVSRRTSASAKYPKPTDPFNVPAALNFPVPLGVKVFWPGSNILDINEPRKEVFINDGYTIIDNRTGDKYRVLERVESQPGIFNRIILDRPWLGGPAGIAWVVPPSFAGGRGPCIVVYQTEIRF
jgi:type II secretory pathway pseudopilin PulG